ncbi:MAG: 4-hydroxythreonine-4-phosphate dehydrogenase PdxA [Pseudomonadota bacterium]
MPPLPVPPIALTMGEPGGVGPEIALKAYASLKSRGPIFFAIADPSVFVDRGSTIALIRTPHEAATIFEGALPILDLGVAARATLGRADAASAPAVIASIERAVGYTLSGEASAVVTNPIQKASLIAAGFKYQGHTEFLEALTASAPMPKNRKRGAVMMIAGPDLRTVPLTIHLSVRRAAESITTDMIVEKATIVMEALTHDFGFASPRLAISGLNPHAGEGGVIGTEDRDVIAPAVARLREIFGVNVAGPLPADTMFHAEARRSYDAALCMLHDQALIPAKTLAFHEAVNITLGLPIIRTSPDHGTALDIAGKGLANAGSLIAALNLAASMASARRAAR